MLDFPSGKVSYILVIFLMTKYSSKMFIKIKRYFNVFASKLVNY